MGVRFNPASPHDTLEALINDFFKEVRLISRFRMSFLRCPGIAGRVRTQTGSRMPVGVCESISRFEFMKALR